MNNLKEFHKHNIKEIQSIIFHHNVTFQYYFINFFVDYTQMIYMVRKLVT